MVCDDNDIIATVVLHVVLHRFHYEGIWRDKITTNVDFPLESLDMSRYISGPRSQKTYDLYAVSVSWFQMYEEICWAYHSAYVKLSFVKHEGVVCFI
jgi:Ubiquitin carboxyl-terminal hydrolase